MVQDVGFRGLGLRLYSLGLLGFPQQPASQGCPGV